MGFLGNRVVRTEDPRFLTVGGTYVGDLRLPNATWAGFARSTVAHARIVRVDVLAARSMPGVVGVFVASDLAITKAPSMFPGMVAPPFLRPFLATDRVRFVGECVAVIVAETAAQAADAAEAVVIEYDPLPVVVDVEEAATDAVILFDEAGTNICSAMPNLMTANFDDCDVVVRGRVLNQRMAVAPMEVRCAAAHWEADRMIMYASCQGVHQVRSQLELAYGMGPDQIRVITPDVGGGFGAKGFPHVEEMMLGELSRLVGRPVQWVETRTENLLGMVHARGQVQNFTIGGSRDGRITAYHLDLLQEAGAYPNVGSALTGAGFLMLTGCYDITNVGFNARSVVSNTGPVGAFRGAGRPEATAAIERAIDVFAFEIGMDPADVRRKNLLGAFSDGHTTATGTRYDSGAYPAALERVLDAVGYDALRAEQQARRARGDRLMLGLGLSSYVEITGMAGPNGASEYGEVELRADGTVLAKTGSTPHGQGHVTTWAMLIADELGVPMESITVVFGDTDVIPHSQVTGGSRSAQIAGSSMIDASQRLVDAARARAADLLEASASDVVLDREVGRFHVQGTPARSIGWADVGMAADQAGQVLSGLSQFVQPGASFPFGAHCAVVEVDAETGAVRLLRMVAVDDCGTLINPLLADGQVHGGLATGVAQALLEEIRYDLDGNVLTSNFADYSIISAAELPSFERIEMVTRSPLNPMGAKGIGEAGTVGSTPAVQNAVADALAHLGVRQVEMPCTAERVWRAITEHRAAGRDVTANA